MDWAIKIRPLAFLDLDEAATWYNYQKAGLGIEFLIEANIFIEKLAKNPYAFRMLFDPVRRIVLKRFPYKILYFIENEKVIIIGIVHQKRSNRYLKRRYKN